ncbi:MAG: flagellar hook-basal body complex protein FliE [Alphaproteobacteria bacterium]|nr:MAG: flagellar hook-basal body complex protein FliE [Alphaproteobacteria bacterium]
MEAKIVDAANAYASALSRASDAPQGTAGAQPSAFAQMVTDAVAGLRETAAGSESLSALALNKQADVLDVVMAVNNAEMTLETVVAVRDRVITAYNEIMRMPI